MELSRRLEPMLMPLIASLTLGLAPFVPQPHVWEKLTWLMTGREFAMIDIFDLLLHGAPWVWLLWTMVGVLRGSREESPASHHVVTDEGDEGDGG